MQPPNFSQQQTDLRPSESLSIDREPTNTRDTIAPLPPRTQAQLTGWHGNYRSVVAALQNAKPKTYEIIVKDRQTAVALIAPHGGLIESGTSEFVKKVAGERYSLYSFEGYTKKMDPELRVSSAYFDEPRCLELLHKTKLPIVIHGSYEWGQDYPHDLFLGGLATREIKLLENMLSQAGISVGYHPKFPGTHPRNICNHGTKRQGIQIELHPKLQDAFHKPCSSYERDVTDLVTDVMQTFLKYVNHEQYWNRE